MTDSAERLTAAHEAYRAKQAEALESLAAIDVQALVASLEQDAERGDMSAGQRKTAHLLLTNFLPKSNDLAKSANALDDADKTQMLAALGIIDRLLKPALSH